jgi:hypothetical protein
MVVELALLVDTPDDGLRTSPWMVFGGVRRLPTLATVVGACDDCETEMVWWKGYLCMGGGGSSKLPN